LVVLLWFFAYDMDLRVGTVCTKSIDYIILIRSMDIRAVDLNLLKAFDALIRERAVTRAAGRIGLSQPAMSHALSRLRSLFGDDLFVRTPDRMEPTARAREIAPLVSAAIEHIEAALNLGVGFDPARNAGIFTAGMAEYAEVALVGRLAEAFAKQAANATLRLTPLTGAEAAEQLDSGGIDVAVAHLRPLPGHLDSMLLLRDPFVLLARPGAFSGGAIAVARSLCGAQPRARLAARRHHRRGRPCSRRFRIEAPHRPIGRDLSGAAGGSLGVRSRRHCTAPHRSANCRPSRHRSYAAADRSFGARFHGLPSPRRERTGTGLVPLAGDRSGE
jgi:DNA-binding transcriptional LysR family regulator